MKTEDKILAKALEMFNQNGIEYTGLRELAVLLGIRVSNITYYFPTKDDLVFRLTQDLRKLNFQDGFEEKPESILAFLEQRKRVFGHQQKYRALMLSFVHLVNRNKLFQEQYDRTQAERNAQLMSALQELTDRGYFKPGAESGVETLVSAFSLILRFWLSEAAISYRHLSPEEQQRHYLRLIADLMAPYATEKGKKEIEEFKTSLLQTG